MAKRAYQGGMPKPDRRGYYRPEVGGVRFIVGHKNEVSEGEARRRLEAVRDLFNRQATCSPSSPDSDWHSTALEIARQLAKGQPPIVSPPAAESDDPISEYVRGRIYGYRVHEARKWMPDVGIDEGLYREEVDSQREWLREEIQRAIGELQGGVVQEAKQAAPSNLDPSNLETRTFFTALSAYQDRLKKVGKRDSDGNLTTRVRHQIDRVRYIKEHRKTDFPLWQLDFAKLEEITAYWANRPTTKKGHRCSWEHAHDMLKEWWGFLTWLDKDSQWRWRFPDRANETRRTPVRLPEDDVSEAFSTVNKPTYTPEQLATIVEEADDFGRALIALCVNCAFGASEVGQWSTKLFTLHKSHPHATAIGFRTSDKHSWITGNRPKTGVYGEHLLWPEVAEAISPFLDGRSVFPVTKTGSRWYRTHSSNPQAKFNGWWAKLVTRAKKKHPDMPKYPFGSLRDTFPDIIRNEIQGGGELASLCLHHGSTTNDDLLNLYTKLPFRRLFEATEVLREKFLPMLRLLK